MKKHIDRLRRGCARAARLGPPRTVYWKLLRQYSHDLSPRSRGHTRTTHVYHTVHITAAPITHRGRCHTRVFGEFSEASEEFVRIPETAFGAPRSDSRGVGDIGRCAAYRPSATYTMHPQALVAHSPVVAIGKLLIPLPSKALVHCSRLIRRKQGVVQWRLHACRCLS
jgi:hypothetical protein